MKWVKGVVLVVGLMAPFATAVSAHAETASGSKVDTATTATKPDDGKDSSKLSEADRRAKASDCSEQADKKKLHGEARKKFRAACKRK